MSIDRPLNIGDLDRSLFVSADGTPPRDMFADPEFDIEEPLRLGDVMSQAQNIMAAASLGLEGMMPQIIDSDPVAGRDGAPVRSARASLVIPDPIMQMGSRLSVVAGHFPVVKYEGIIYQTEDDRGNEKRLVDHQYQNARLVDVAIGIAPWNKAVETAHPALAGLVPDTGSHLMAVYKLSTNRELSQLSAEDPARVLAEALHGVTPSGDWRDPTRGVLFVGRLESLNNGLARFQVKPLAVPEGVDPVRFDLAQRVNAGRYLKEPEPGVPSLMTRLMNRSASRVLVR